MPRAARSLLDATARPLGSLTFDQRMAAVLLVAMALLPLSSPVMGGSYLLHIGERALILAIAALSLELLVGVGGMVSFGHAAFLGIGAYAGGIAASHGVGTLSVALPAALGASALFAVLTGAIAVRTRGVYFIMITLAFGQMAFFVATSLAPYGGDDGLSWPARTAVLGTGILENEWAFFYLTLALAIAVYVLISRLIGSRFGRVLRGLTDSETRLQAIGFAPYPFRLAAYVIAGTLCGLAGFLLGNHVEFVSPAYMHWTRSGELIVMVLLGGTGTVYGPILGALALVLLEEVLAGFTVHWKAILGPMLVLLVLFARGGMAGAIEQGRRRRPSPRQLLDALATLPAMWARDGSAAAAASWAHGQAVVRSRIDALRPLAERGATGISQRYEGAVSASARHLDRLTQLSERWGARLQARWDPWREALAQQWASLALRAEGWAAEARARWRPWRAALGERLAALEALLERWTAEVRLRWDRWELALVRRLRELRVLARLAERRVAASARRWRGR